MTDVNEAQTVPGRELEKLNENLHKVEELSQRLVRVMANRKGHAPSLDSPGPDLYANAMSAYWKEALTNPAKLIEQQMGYWTKTVWQPPCDPRTIAMPV